MEGKLTVKAIHSWQNAIMKSVDTQKQTKKRKTPSSAIGHSSFSKCADYMENATSIENHKNWASYFRDCGKGMLPKNFSIIGDDIMHGKRTRHRLTLMMEVGIQCEKLIEFFKKHDKSLVITTTDVTEKKEKKKIETWNNVRMKHGLKHSLIREFVIRTCMDFGIEDEDIIDSHTSFIIDNIDLKGLDMSETIFENERIVEFPSIKITEKGISANIFKEKKILNHGYYENLEEPVLLYEE